MVVVGWVGWGGATGKPAAAAATLLMQGRVAAMLSSPCQGWPRPETATPVLEQSCQGGNAPLHTHTHTHT